MVGGGMCGAGAEMEEMEEREGRRGSWYVVAIVLCLVYVYWKTWISLLMKMEEIHREKERWESSCTFYLEFRNLPI